MTSEAVPVTLPRLRWAGSSPRAGRHATMPKRWHAGLGNGVRVFLLAGGALLTVGVVESQARVATTLPEWPAWLPCAGVSGGSARPGADCATSPHSPPCSASGGSGPLADDLVRPVAAAVVETGVVCGVAAVVQWRCQGGGGAGRGPASAASVVLVYGARLLRQMKTDLPTELLLPVTTPFGGLSGLRFSVWLLTV